MMEVRGGGLVLVVVCPHWGDFGRGAEMLGVDRKVVASIES